MRLARQEGSASWFALIRNLSNVQTGLLASVIGSSNPVVAVPPQFQSLFDIYSDIFTEPRELAPGQITHRIDLLDESSTPPIQRAYCMSPTELAESRRLIDSMLEKGWIQPSASPQGALLLFVRNITSELYMFIDYRMLKKQTRLDRFPIPRIDDLLDKLANATVFNKLDLSNAYHQVPIEEGHQFKTAF